MGNGAGGHRSEKYPVESRALMQNQRHESNTWMATARAIGAKLLACVFRNVFMYVTSHVVKVFSLIKICTLS